MRSPFLCQLLFAMMLPACGVEAQIQTTAAEPLPNAPAPQPVPNQPFATKTMGHQDVVPYYAGLFCGLGASTSPSVNIPSGGCGAGFTFIPLPLFVEFGVLGPQANRSYVSGYLSVDASIPLARVSASYLPLAIVGYSRLFETGHSFDYGLALDLPHAANRFSTVRVELRDYWTFANPTQHNVMLRVGWISPVTD